MTRKKVKIVWIVNDSARKASLKKRKTGLLKKVSELTTLCGVNALVIIYSPEDKEPAMWPSRPVVQQLLARFHSLPEMERCKKMMNQETYLKERVTKVREQLKKHQRRNKEMDASHLMREIDQGKELDGFNVGELHGLFWFTEEKKKEIRKRLDYFHQVNQLQLQPGSLPYSPAPPAPGNEMIRIGGSSGGDHRRTPSDSVLWDQWFMDVMDNSENTSGSSVVKSDNIGLTPHQGFVDSCGVSTHTGLLPPGSYRTSMGSSSGLTDPTSGFGLPYWSFRDLNSGGSEMAMPHGGSINIGGCSSVEYDIGLGLQPHENIGVAGSSASSDIGLPSDFFAGSIAGSDVGLPYDVTKPWPSNFYP